ncbi:Imm50 family immunity protein [Pyxidicoccus sp. MSG2]|uniref:Imm50 family immunity protein n=1 Tax=Pyxidicoccus sp. MSG2 TaxID=2996790 RepID=UPI00226E85E1|nr:Imm50 family immunity protein [Pyxidicoccus sp. MSG2]MCY1019273.1 Imm50 family immunity protein [Pyxidicoccus sp. MSG2]
MDWIDSIERAVFLRSLFPEAPSLHGVRVLELGLHQDGPRVLIRFDLNEFPARPPAKWGQSQANRVQLRLMGIGVRRLEVRGWSANSIVDIEVTPATSDGVGLVARGEGFSLEAVFDHLSLDGVSAYQDSGV